MVSRIDVVVAPFHLIYAMITASQAQSDRVHEVIVSLQEYMDDAGCGPMERHILTA
jgi:hypothetical protein